MEFHAFPKIPRLNRRMVITEKIDGTNAQVTIVPAIGPNAEFDATFAVADLGEYLVFAGSRKRYVVPGKDNYGFAAWVKDHAISLVTDLGVGIHYGEWWGQGIQRRYGLDHKRLSLFNTSWSYPEEFTVPGLGVVPVLYKGDFSTETIDEVVAELSDHGSYAAPGFDNPEGVVVYHVQSRNLYKVTLEGDQAKGNH
jgi:hypothetical protein